MWNIFAEDMGDLYGSTCTLSMFYKGYLILVPLETSLFS